MRLNRPEVGPRVLERPHLLRALAENAARPVTLVIADAGYGKTTLVGAFCRQLLRPVVWYSMMPSDADPVVFGRYLLEGFRRDAPRFGRDFSRALDEARPGARSVEMLAGTLVNELGTLRGPTRLLVLDDFQEVAGNRAVVALTESLLRHLPPTVRVLVAARSTPPLALERLRSSGDVFELHSNHLRFSREELARLFADVYRRPLTESQLAALEETTQGWPTAVHLVHESLQRDEAVGLEDVLADVRASNLQMHEYLSSEVYARLDPDARRLLDRTVALQRFDVPLATALAQLPNAAAILDGLVRRGLVRAYGHGAQVSFECHDLVRSFVRGEIESRGGPESVRGIEAETATALALRGEPERALRHWLKAGDAGEAAHLIRGLAPGLQRDGRAASLHQFLSELPETLVREDVELALLDADARQNLGEWNEAELQYQDVLQRCRTTPRRDIECRALLGLGKVLNLRGRHEQVLGMAERGLAISRRLDPALRARLMQMKAGAHFYLGQYQAAVEVLGQVRSLLEVSPDPELLLPTVHNLAGAYAALGKFREASTEFRVALAQVRGTSSPRAPLYLSNLAFHLADLGDLAEARRAAEEGLLAAQRFSNRMQECVCHQALAQVQAQSADLDGALASLRRAEDLNAELRMDVIEADLLLLHGRVFLARGQYRRAVEFVTQAIEKLKARPEDPRLAEAQATLAWCELRAGRLHVAHAQLEPLVEKADLGENDYLRMRLHWWLGEAQLALDERHPGPRENLALALKLVTERGYLYFLKVQAREDPAPLLFALAEGIEPDTVATALVEAGAEVEQPLLELLREAQTSIAETALAVLAEVGGQASRTELPAIGRQRRALEPSIRRTLRHVEGRRVRGAAPGDDASIPAVRLVLYGPPHLRLDGKPLPASAWRTQRAFHMLVYLALHPRGAESEVLIDTFWPGRQAAAGRRNLHPTLSYVRSVLPRASEPPILREAGRYMLNPAYPITCDFWDVDHALDAARGLRDRAERRGALERAVATAGGRFLEGLYADWSEELHRRESDRMEKLVLDLAGLCKAAGDYEQALTHYRRALEFDAYREGTVLQVIECHVKLGNRRAGMVEFDRLRSLLRSELDVDPLPETEEAVRALLGGTAGERAGDEDLEIAEPVGPQKAMPIAQVRLKPVATRSSR